MPMRSGAPDVTLLGMRPLGNPDRSDPLADTDWLLACGGYVSFMHRGDRVAEPDQNVPGPTSIGQVGVTTARGVGTDVTWR